MAQDITVDSIIRRYLAMSGLPLHYYVPMLVIAKQGLEEMHYDALQKIKHAVLAVSDAYEATIPSDCVEIISIGSEAGDKIRTFGFDRTMNNNDNGGEAFETVSDQSVYGQNYNSTNAYLENFFNEYGDFKGKQFGRKVVWDESYTYDRDLGLIRLNNKNTEEEIHLIYLSLPEKVSNKSVIHPFAQRALIEFIGWQKSVYFKEKDMIAYKRNEFYQEYRKLKGRMNKLTTIEIKRAIRRDSNLAVKG